MKIKIALLTYLLCLSSQLVFSTGSIDDFSKPFAFKKDFVFYFKVSKTIYDQFLEKDYETEKLHKAVKILTEKMAQETEGSQIYNELNIEKMSLIHEMHKTDLATLHEMLGTSTKEAILVSSPKLFKQGEFYKIPDLKPVHQSGSHYYISFNVSINLYINPITIEKIKLNMAQLKTSEYSAFEKEFLHVTQILKTMEHSVNYLRSKYNYLMWQAESNEEEYILNKTEFLDFLDDANIGWIKYFENLINFLNFLDQNKEIKEAGDAFEVDEQNKAWVHYNFDTSSYSRSVK